MFAPSLPSSSPAQVMTPYGTFRVIVLPLQDGEAVVLLQGEVRGQQGVPLWVHAQCLHGDVFRSTLCNCGNRLAAHLMQLGRLPFGLLIYLRPAIRQKESWSACPGLSLSASLSAQRIATELGAVSVELRTTLPDQKAMGGQTAIEQATPTMAGLRKASSADRLTVTLTYAQSIDGSIAAAGRTPVQLSSPSSMLLTHALRASHDAIIVGVNTVLTDDPQLTVRHVEGRNPQPVVFDGTLRTSVSARLFANERKPWFFCKASRSLAAQRQLEAAGARVFVMPSDRHDRVCVQQVLASLQQEGLHSILVEGGAAMISSFLVSHRVDEVVITIAPQILGGIPATTQAMGERFHITHLRVEHWGPDVVLRGRPRLLPATCQSSS